MGKESLTSLGVEGLGIADYLKTRMCTYYLATRPLLRPAHSYARTPYSREERDPSHKLCELCACTLKTDNTRQTLSPVSGPFGSGAYASLIRVIHSVNAYAMFWILVAGFGQRADNEVVKVEGCVGKVKQLRSVMAAEVA